MAILGHEYINELLKPFSKLGYKQDCPKTNPDLETRSNPGQALIRFVVWIRAALGLGRLGLMKLGLGVLGLGKLGLGLGLDLEF